MWGCDFMGYNSWMGGIFHFGFFHLLIWAAILIILALAAWRLFKYFFSGKKPLDQDRKDSFEILKERYAKGEISAEDFKKMKKVLLTHYV